MKKTNGRKDINMLQLESSRTDKMTTKYGFKKERGTWILRVSESTIICIVATLSGGSGKLHVSITDGHPKVYQLGSSFTVLGGVKNVKFSHSVNSAIINFRLCLVSGGMGVGSSMILVPNKDSKYKIRF